MRRGEALWKRQDGRGLWVRETARCVRDPTGRIAWYEDYVEDITADHGPIDLVVTDGVMPQMGGPAMVAALEVRLQQRGEELLHKPFSPNRLARAVRDAWDR